MKDEFISFLRQECGVKEDQKVLLAISGGPDSMLLLHLLHKNKQPLELAHCNFGLRGQESEQDQSFIENYASERGLKLNVKCFEIDKRKGSIQLQARKLRHEWFESLRSESNSDYIALGSHLDDKLETAFINFMRGTGPAGIRNMNAKDGFIIRPLLFSSKEDILELLETEQVPFRSDSSNEKTDYLRNKIRHELIPVVKNIKPEILKTYGNTSRVMLAYEQVFNASTTQFLNEHLSHTHEGESILSKKSIGGFPSAFGLLHAWLKDFQFSTKQIKDIVGSLNSNETQIFASPSHELISDRHQLALHSESHDFKEELIDELPYTSTQFNLNISRTSIPSSLNSENSLFINVESKDLCLRAWRAGDKIQPLGMSGRKLVSDVLIDEKISGLQKRKTSVLLYKNEVCAIPGIMISEAFKLLGSEEDCVQITPALAAS